MKRKNKHRNAEEASAPQDAPAGEPEESAAAGEEPRATAEERGAAAGGDADEEEGRDHAGQEELNRMQDRYLRLAAEYDNYRKRTERERSESWLRAQADLAGRLLDPLDDLDRVTAEDGEKASAEAVIEGVRLVERKLLRALEDAGLETVEADGASFDPEVHEALMTVPAEDPGEDDMVADVFQKGYRFKGVLLRPARVRVKKFEE